ncbi:pyridoxal phosphate-dependent aminotransferase [Kaistia dalseonensis]|uniref:aspartate transaminase n=1 Tax=Kaistia dalseonensis TaxID=410840 RepID=A0ABU0HFY5_9HYPH|nr:pyridoxal phosphate-dependent aminotransferase [Kaistia dalseonensis]MCX5497770.1 pyridoxal phosphate-dependent aminotransferase [Kaistia dalseonensis]MDQ0440414.1 aspartate/methionine/tyrosine aminotransferase [Kaistia dalseonensis]
MSAQPAPSRLRSEATNAPESGIVEVFNYGRDRPGLIPLWVGEGDLPTPDFIADAARASLSEGETFYTYQRGIPELRTALARYHARVFHKPFDPERFFVTSGGMPAIQIALRMVAGESDEVVVPTPAWPNFAAAAEIGGARTVAVPMSFGNAGWMLDLDRYFAAVTPRTTALFLNSPCNPTGWTATREELIAIRDFARARGLWIIADEVYNRFFYEADRAPSFYDIAEPDERILYVNTLSKNWAMTGWRVGWLSAPPELGQVVENLIQYSSSGTAKFMQRGAVAAIEQGDAFIDFQIERAKRAREIVCAGLEATGRVRFSWPAGAFYLFFSVDGEPDTRKLGLRLVDEANVGLAPGDAFGPGGAGYMRMCFLRDPAQLTEATERLAIWLARG